MRSTVSVFFFKIRVRLNPILPRFHSPDAGSLFQFSAQQRQAGHDARSFSARRGASRPTGPAYHRGLVLFLYNRPPGGAFSKNMARRELPPGSACQKTCVEKKPLKLGRGSSRGRQPASSGIECPECLARQGVQRAQRGLSRRAAAGKYWHSCRLPEKSLDFFDSLRPEGTPSGPSVRKSAAVNCPRPPAPPRGCGPDRPPPGSGR